MKKKIAGLIEKSISACVAAGLWADDGLSFVEVETPANELHGDFSSNAAMVLASRVKQNPRSIAGAIRDHLDDPEGILEKTEIAGPGFLNFFIKDALWQKKIKDILEAKDNYGRSNLGSGKKVQVEFVSANPTGPLHIGHARGAVVGDVLANLLSATGYRVSREYYINDAGSQMDNLGKSVLHRYREVFGEKADFPENCYQGGYIRDIANEIVQLEGDVYLEKSPEEAIAYFNSVAAEVILEGIRKDLRDFGVTFDTYFSEKQLYHNDGVNRLLSSLREQGFIYSDGGTLWFKTTDYGDEKDRVVIRQNGEPTYFAADIAYHRNKFSRGFDMLIDIWGADHHGYIPRLKAAVEALGYERDALKIILVQLVNLLRAGEPVAMSTRAGEFVTLREVMDEVGTNAARYNFLMRRSDSHLDFDLEVAKKQSNENPVYYVQYAHARICSIIRLATEKGMACPSPGNCDFSLLESAEEKTLIKMMAAYPDMLEGAAKSLEVHRITFFLNELAAVFHSYYNKARVVTDDAAISSARLALVEALRIVLKNALKILGVGAPEKM